MSKTLKLRNVKTLFRGSKMGSHESDGGHRLVFFTGRERNENEDRDTNESLLKESDLHDDIVQVRFDDLQCTSCP